MRPPSLLCVLLVAPSATAIGQLNPLKWLHMQKVVTAMLANNVLPHSEILELTATVDTKTLTYYTTPNKVTLCSLQPVDSSLVAAAAKAANVAVDSLPPMQADPLDLPVHEGAYDAVVCFQVLCQLSTDDVTRAIERAQAALRPGGRLVWIEPDGKEQLSTMISASWLETCGRAAEVFADAEEGYSLGVAVKPRVVAGRSRSERGRRKNEGKGFGRTV